MTRGLRGLPVPVAFLGAGLVLGTWFASIPALRSELGMATDDLGMALAGFGLGFAFAVPLARRRADRGLSTRVILLALCTHALALGALGLSGGGVSLFVLLVLFGAADGTVTVLLNVFAVALERDRGGSIVARCHGFVSLGNITGALLASAGAARGLGGPERLMATAVALLVVLLLVVRRLPQPDWLALERQPEAGGRGAIGLLGLVVFVVVLLQSLVTDWSGLYVVTVFTVGSEWSGAGYAAFTVALAGGRFVADTVIVRLGRRRVFSVAVLSTAAALALAAGAPVPALAVAGFALVGLGMSGLAPLLVSLAGHAGGGVGARGVGAVIMASAVAFVLTPLVVGFSAAALGFRATLGVVAAVMAALALVPVARSPADARGRGRRPPGDA